MSNKAFMKELMNPDPSQWINPEDLPKAGELLTGEIGTYFGIQYIGNAEDKGESPS